MTRNQPSHKHVAILGLFLIILTKLLVLPYVYANTDIFYTAITVLEIGAIFLLASYIWYLPHEEYYEI